jgi:hypothetical protein
MPAYLQLENYGLLSPALSSFGEEREKNGTANSLAAARQFPAELFLDKHFCREQSQKHDKGWAANNAVHYMLTDL